MCLMQCVRKYHMCRHFPKFYFVILFSACSSFLLALLSVSFSPSFTPSLSLFLLSLSLHSSLHPLPYFPCIYPLPSLLQSNLSSLSPISLHSLSSSISMTISRTFCYIPGVRIPSTLISLAWIVCWQLPNPRPVPLLQTIITSYGLWTNRGWKIPSVINAKTVRVSRYHNIEHWPSIQRRTWPFEYYDDLIKGPFI